MPEAATAIFYTEDSFFLQAGRHNACFINIMFLCLHFPQKLSMKGALPLMLDILLNFRVIPMHLHVPSAVLLVEVCVAIVSID